MNEIERARDIIRRNWNASSRPFFVCFSGGKDSTLLAQLVLEVRATENAQKKIFIAFNNTGYEMDAKNEQMTRARAQFEAVGVEFMEIVPEPKHRFLVKVIGRATPCRTSVFAGVLRI